MLKSIGLTLLIVIVVFGGSFFATLYAREKGWIQGKEIVEEPGAYDDQTEEDGEGADWMAANGEAQWPYLVPTEGPVVTPKTISFAYNGTNYEVKASVDSAVYHGAVAALRGYEIPSDADDYEKEDLLMAYYNKLAYDPQQDGAIESLLKAFQDIRDQKELDSDEYLELLVKYVQSIPYDPNRGFAEAKSAGKGNPRMPVQVLVDGKADCDEKVMLLSCLLTREGYEVVGLYFSAEKHMALGVQAADGEGYEGTGYAYVETTVPAYVSEVPTSFVNDVKLESEPIQIAFGDDSERLGEYSATATQEVARIIEVRDGAPAAGKEQKAYIESTALSKASYRKEEAKYKACYVAENSFRTVVDKNGTITGDFMDRVPAITWIDKNAWW
ncbi:MAG: hypothetical protein LBJ07_02790 [Actinomycetes bacterium]|jgi:hypothetical protein|nr:hypothetical protein [Actinomycetes bacterium]